MSIIGSGHALLLASEVAAPIPTEISRSLRFNSGDSANLNRTPTSAGNRKTWTWAGWVKRSVLSSTQRIFSAGSGSSYTEILFISDTLKINTFNSGSDVGQVQTQAVFRDPSAWYHVVISFNAAGTSKIYVNGVEQPLTTTTAISNIDHQINNTVTHRIGSYFSGASYLDAYLADVHLVDGQALSPTSFGEFDATTGVWNPIAYTGSHGTNGFHLTFGDNSGTSSTTLGKDAAGSNNWTPNNFSVASGPGNDSLVDVPRNGDETDTGAGGEVRGNYATLNPLFIGNGQGTTLSNGNLDYLSTAGAGQYATRLNTIGVSSGKWYAEFTVNAAGNGFFIGITSDPSSINNYLGQNSVSFAYLSNGQKWTSGSGSAYGASFTTNDVIGVALDLDAGTLVFYKNGSSQGTAYSSLASGTYFIGISGTTNASVASNFGARAFSYSAPSGFKALCTANLPTPTIEDGSAYMDVKLYTGNGSTQTISGLGFSPDWVWLKKRSGLADHYLYDQVRGATYRLYSNTTDAESTSTTGLTAFTSDGFSVGSANDVNQSSNTYAAWTWDAGSSTVSNTDGSITSSVRANPSAGFSVVSFTGTSSSGTIGHGLGAAPGMIIVKCRSTGGTGWPVYHQSLGGVDKVVTLQSTGAVQTISNYWNSSAPSSTTFGVASGYDNNVNGADMIAYCFAPVAGYSAMGSYVGTGSATNSPFIWTGFRPQWILVKNISINGSNWRIVDAARNTYNEANLLLNPNSSNSEQTTTANEFDILSNGFKLRGADNDTNGSGETLIYYAVAENPFSIARAR